jgi:hypothetical protein
VIAVTSFSISEVLEGRTASCCGCCAICWSRRALACQPRATRAEAKTSQRATGAAIARLAATLRQRAELTGNEVDRLIARATITDKAPVDVDIGSRGSGSVEHGADWDEQ